MTKGPAAFVRLRCVKRSHSLLAFTGSFHAFALAMSRSNGVTSAMRYWRVTEAVVFESLQQVVEKWTQTHP